MPDEKYPGIARAALEIALDNGGINRARSEEQQRRDLARWIDQKATTRFPNLDEIDAWLASQSDQQLKDICCGGEGEPEQDAAMRHAPPFTDAFLTAYFEEVC